MNRHRKLTVLGLAALSAALAVPVGSASGVPTFRVAVTFDSASTTSWMHADPPSSPLSQTIVSTAGDTVGRTTWTTATTPPEIAGIPGIVAGDKHVGQFPLSQAVAAPAKFAVVKVTPTAFPVGGDVLAPDQGDITFGADIKFETLPADDRTDDNGNNVIQRGLSQGDQYKIQIDGKGSPKVFKASCFVKGNAQLVTSVENSTVITAGPWYRLKCVRTTVNSVDHLVLTVTNLTTLASAAAPKDGTALSNLDYPDATTTKPYPLSVGGKVKGNGQLDVGDSDQFNGRIDNAFVAIG